eukprot:2724226-Amphidinium_carterae.1
MARKLASVVKKLASAAWSLCVVLALSPSMTQDNTTFWSNSASDGKADTGSGDGRSECTKKVAYAFALGGVLLADAVFVSLFAFSALHVLAQWPISPQRAQRVLWMSA